MEEKTPETTPTGSVQKEEPVIKAGGAAGGSVGFATLLMTGTNTIGWTEFSANDQLAIATTVGIIAPVVAALVARMKVWAPEKRC